MNRELLIKVRDQIAAHPEHFDMDYYLVASPDKSVGEPKYESVAKLGCGTTACIAGWAMCLEPEKTLGLYSQFPYIPEDVIGAKLLDIDEDAAMELFFVSNWPDPFFDDYTKASRLDDIKGMADTAVAYINHLLEQEALNAN